MDIRPNHQRSDARETARERIEDHAEGLRDALGSRSSRDQIDLSPTARLLGAAGEEDRSALVAELKAAYENGSLNTPERIREAAERLLGG